MSIPPRETARASKTVRSKRDSYAAGGFPSRFQMATAPNHTSPGSMEMHQVQDLLWIGLVLGLLALTLGYARLCDEA